MIINAAELAAILERCEWAFGGSLVGPSCPVCGRDETLEEVSEHNDDCLLKSLLDRARGAT